MNYYEHHLGDYAQATAHLSLIEDAVYSRMIRWYYAEETPLPPDERAVCRIVRATTKSEREAVHDVLVEFFDLRDDGFHQTRCDADIERYQAKQGKARASANARWSKVERNADAMRTHSDGTSERNAVASQTHDERIATRERNAHQAPDTRHQTKEEQHAPPPVEAGVRGLAGKALKRAGLNPMQFSLDDPRFIALVGQGATPEEFEAIGREAVAKGVKAPFAWVLTVLQSRRTEAAAIVLAPIAAPAPPPTPPSRDADTTAEYLRQRSVALTPEEKARADEARKRAMQAVRG